MQAHEGDQPGTQSNPGFEGLRVGEFKDPSGATARRKKINHNRVQVDYASNLRK